MEWLTVTKGEPKIYMLICRYCLKYFIRFSKVSTFKTASFPGVVVGALNPSVRETEAAVGRYFS